MGEVVPFVPRNVVTGKPMLEQIATEAVLDVTMPKCHDDLVGSSVLEYESSLGYWPKEPA